MQPTIQLLAGSWGALFPYNLLFGNPMQGGFSTMDSLLRAGAEFNKRLNDEYGISLAWSGHLNSEIALPDGHPAAHCNSPHSILLDRWIEGSLNGTYAPIGRIIPKGFGYPWSDLGAFRNNDENIRRFHHDAMVLSFQMSESVRQANAGPGHVIYWDGPDSIDWQRVILGEDLRLSYDIIPTLIEWKRLVEGVGNALKEAIGLGYTKKGTELLVEDKGGGDPGYLGILLDSKLSLKAIDLINEIAGAPVAFYQPESCHVRGTGERISHSIETARMAGKWGGHVHLNCGPLAPINFSELLAVDGGTPMSNFTPATDPDFNVWPCSIPEWVDDNVGVIRQGAIYSAETGRPFWAEFDSKIGRGYRYVKTEGERAEAAIENLWKMCEWTLKTFAQVSQE